MALIKCPDCGREVSDLAPACPNCGRPIARGVEKRPGAKHRPRWAAPTVALGLLLLTVGVGVFYREPIRAWIVGRPPASPAQELTAAQVIRVIDGDTVEVSISGARDTIRLIGMDTPEVRPAQCHGPEASARATELLANQSVLLEKDTVAGERDSFNRLLRYIWLPDNQLFNDVMIREGHAKQLAYRDQAYKHREQFEAAERDAHQSGRGFWGPPCFGNPRPPRPPVQTPPAVSGTPSTPNPTPAPIPGSAPPGPGGTCPDTHLIKGNRPSMIYHVPGSRDYDRTRAESCFADEAAAQAAGFRPARPTPTPRAIPSPSSR